MGYICEKKVGMISKAEDVGKRKRVTYLDKFLRKIRENIGFEPR